MPEKTLHEQFNLDYFAIEAYFDVLNEDKTHFASSNDICTPIALIKEMVDKVPKKFWKRDNLRVLDCCCGNGNFHAYISTKTSLDNLYFNEISDIRIQNVYKYFGHNIHMTKQDFLEYDENDKYDLIVANPPYAKFTDDGKRAAKNHNLARLFIEKALKCTKENGYILFIVPDNWMSFSDRNTLPQLLTQYQFRFLSIHTPKKFFPTVGSTFTYFLLQKSPNKDPFLVANGYKIRDKQTVKMSTGLNFIPLYCSNLVMGILDKTVNDNSIEKYAVETSSDLHKHNKGHLFSDTQDATHQYKLWHTPRQCYWSEQAHKYQEGWKVFISLTTQYETFIDECGMSQSIAFIRCKDKEEAQRINEELNNPLYVFINNITRYGNFGNNRVLERLPVLSKVHLTDEEKEFIDKFNKAYYRSEPESKRKKETGKNATDIIIHDISDLDDEVNFSNYEYRDYFKFLCHIRPNQDRQALEIEDISPEDDSKTGLIYIFVIHDKIFKIGQTTNTMYDRIQSYNCGSIAARNKGTCSVTNFFVKQSFLQLNEVIDVYAYFPPKATYRIFTEDVESSEAPSKFAERKIVADFERKYHKKPIGCIQS